MQKHVSQKNYENFFFLGYNTKQEPMQWYGEAKRKSQRSRKLMQGPYSSYNPLISYISHVILSIQSIYLYVLVVKKWYFFSYLYEISDLKFW